MSTKPRCATCKQSYLLILAGDGKWYCARHDALRKQTERLLERLKAKEIKYDQTPLYP